MDEDEFAFSFYQKSFSKTIKEKGTIPLQIGTNPIFSPLMDIRGMDFFVNVEKASD